MLKRLIVACLSALLVATSTVPILASADSSTNLIPNPSFETSADGINPDSWQASSWGTNTSTFSYLNTGHTGAHSAEVQTTSYTNGAANWYYADVPVTAGMTYQYENWYQSNVDTEVDAEVVINGTPQYYYLGTVLASDTWTKFDTTFTVPAGGTSMAIYQILAKVGYIISDDYSLNVYTPTPWKQAIVSVSFDDGWTNQYDNAFPVMHNLGIPGTYNIISGEMSNPDEAGYMTSTQVKALYDAGNEIASHTIHHCDLTGQQTDNPTNCPVPISSAQVVSEMTDSQTTLQNLIGAPVTDFAYPYGAYDANSIAVGKQLYESQRTVNAGYNTKDNFDATQLKIYEVDSNITQSQVQAWIDGAIHDKAWLILVYHEVATTPSDPSDATYTTSPTDFAAEMNYIHNSGVATETVHDALHEVEAQLQPPDTTPPVLSNIATSNVSTTGATITWTTDEASTSQVNYGTTATYGSSTPVDSTLDTAHSVALTGLTAGTTYHFQVVSADAATNTATSSDFTFATTPLPANKPGDVNGDGKVDIYDLSIISSNWGTQSGATRLQGDLNGDGKVDIYDLSILSTNWSK